jgi:hypothetical protein
MAHVSQDLKKKLAPAIKAVCKKHGIKATLSVRHHSTLCLNVSKGAIDFGNQGVNLYWIEDHFKDNEAAKNFLLEAKEALKGEDYFDKSDIQSDYFFCSHYFEVNIGKWNKAYVLDESIKKG